MARAADVDYVVQATADPAEADFTVNALGGGGGTVEEGSGAPTSTPAAEGDHYIDTLNGNAYVAVCTTSAACWKQATGAGGGDLLAANNLSDVASAPTSRTNLGLGTIATQAANSVSISGGSVTGITDITVADGGTGASDAGTARTNLGVAIGSDVQAYAAALDAVTGTNTGDEVAASAIVAGVVELATIAETDTGTDDTRAVTPDGLEGSALQTKVNGIETAADVTDATNVVAALAANTANVDFNDVALLQVGPIERRVNTIAATGATETLDVAEYGVHDCTMDEACTFTFSNPAASGEASSFTLILRGAFTPTLPASVDWAGGSAPTYGTPSVYEFLTVDGGTTYLGFLAGASIA